MKKQGLGFYFSIITAVFGVIALCLYISNAGNTYYSDFNYVIVIFTVLSIAATAAGAFLCRLERIGLVGDILLIAAPVLLVIGLAMFIHARAYSMAIILGSDLEKGNELAWDALMQCFYSIGFYAAAMITGIAGAFMKQVKEIENK